MGVKRSSHQCAVSVSVASVDRSAVRMQNPIVQSALCQDRAISSAHLGANSPVASKRLELVCYQGRCHITAHDLDQSWALALQPSMYAPLYQADAIGVNGKASLT